MQGSAKQDLLHRLEGVSNDETDHNDTSDGALRCYDEVVYHILQTYAHDFIISATDAAISNLKKGENQPPLAFNRLYEYVQLWTSLRSD